VLVAYLQQKLVKLCAFARVEAGRGLIEAKQNRLGAHRTGDFEAALRAIRQVARGVVSARREADELKPFPRPFDRCVLSRSKGRKAKDSEQRVA